MKFFSILFFLVIKFEKSIEVIFYFCCYRNCIISVCYLHFFLLEMCVAPTESMKIIRIIIIFDAVSLMYM